VPIAAWPAYDLTTVRQPVNRMVDATVDALLSRIEGDTAPRKIRIPCPLILRGSARKRRRRPHDRLSNRWTDLPDYILGITKEIWEDRGLATLHHYYAPDIPVRTPMGAARGNGPVIASTMATLAEFPDRQLLGEDVIWSDDPDHGSSRRIASSRPAPIPATAPSAPRPGAAGPSASSPTAPCGTT
jgi:hypothetical protein